MSKSKIEAKNELWGITQDMLVDWCMNNPFPGTWSGKWEANHPIWDSFLPGCLSPRQAWNSEQHIRLAVQNLFWILTKSIAENKYFDFVQKHKKLFETALIRNGKIIKSSRDLLCKVLVRFTVAKISPKVTALRGSDMLKIIDASGIDISKGVYCPMAGFGGIKDAAIKWYKKNKITPKNDDYSDLIECYDINDNFCQYYGWTQRDMLEQVVETDKVCLVCPPFGKNYEHWDGTPDEMSDITFIEWYEYIHQYVKAPGYIIVGPEIRLNENSRSNKGLDSNNKERNGLFSKTVGIMLWTDDMYNRFKNSVEDRRKHGIKE